MPLTQDRLTRLAQSLGIALDWNTRAPPSGVKGVTQTRLDPASMAAIMADPILRALSDLGKIIHGPRPSPMGAGFDIECPWIGEHSQRAGSGAIYVPVRTKFKCMHDHCVNKHYGDLYQRMDELVREDSMGLKCMAHYEFDAVDPNSIPLPSIPDPEANWVRDTVYLRAEPRQNFWSVTQRVRMHDDAFNVTWGGYLAPILPEAANSTDDKPKYLTPAQWYRRHRNRRMADGFIHWPGDEALMRREGKLLCNLWQPGRVRPGETVSDDEVQPWLDLTHHVLGTATLEEFENTGIVLDWMAMVAGSWVKPGWFPLIMGPQGFGKDAITLPLRHGLGSMATEIAGAEIGGSFNYWALKRFVAVNELRQTTKGQLTPHDQANALKLWDNTRETVVINEKFMRPYDARNVFALWVTSNERMPLKLDKDDRRFFVFDRYTQPIRHDLLREYLGWWDKDQGAGRKGWELVHSWLLQRWETLADERRKILTGRAIMSDDKQALITASQDEVPAWMLRCIEARSPAPEAWLDIVSSAYVHRRLTTAVRDGDGLSSRTVVPSVDRVGRMLGDLGCKRLNNGNSIYVQGRLLRLWACRDHDLYLPLDPTQLARTVEKMVGASGLSDFTA